MTFRRLDTAASRRQSADNKCPPPTSLRGASQLFGPSIPAANCYDNHLADLAATRTSATCCGCRALVRFIFLLRCIDDGEKQRPSYVFTDIFHYYLMWIKPYSMKYGFLADHANGRAYAAVLRLS